MPPKKGKDKGKGKDEEEKDGVMDAQVLKEVDFVMAQDDMNSLKDKLERYEAKTAELEAKNAELTAQLEKFRGDQKDIYMYMKRLDVKKDSRITELEEKWTELEQEKEDLENNYEAKLHVERVNAKEMERHLREEQANLQKELVGLQEFIAKKDEIEKELEVTKNTLSLERREFEQRVNDLERKNVQEKDKLKKEMLWKIKETKANLLKLTDNQLDITTKRTIMENEQMSSELAYQSRQTEKLIQANDRLIRENTELKREADLQRLTDEDLVRKNHVYQKTIKTLMAKIKALESEKDEEERKKELIDNGFAEEREKANEIIRNLEDETSRLERICDGLQRELDTTREEYREVKDEYQRYMALQDEGTRFILATLEDAKLQIAAQKPGADPEAVWNPSKPIPAVFDELSTNQRERVLRYLFAKLSSFGSLQPPDAVNNPFAEKQPETPFTLPPIATTPRQMTAGSIGSGVVSAVHTPFVPSRGQGGDLGATRPEMTSVGTQTGGQRPTFPGELNVGTNHSPSPEQAYVAIPVNGPVRPWGKRSKDHPLTIHSSTNFLKKGSGTKVNRVSGIP